MREKILGAVSNVNLEIDYSTLFAKFVVIILLILITSFILDYLLSHSVLGKSYRIFVAPGVIIHELSHALLCAVTGARITKISFFDKEGGRVEHQSPKLPVLGPILISLAPFVFGSAVIYFLSKILGISGVDLSAIDISREGITPFVTSTLGSLNLESYKTWVIIYLVLSIAVTMTPSIQDFRNIIIYVVILSLLVWLAYKISPFNFFSLQIPNEIFTLLSNVLILLILSAGLGIIVFVISKVFLKR